MNNTKTPAQQVAAAIARAPRTIFSIYSSPQETFSRLAKACEEFDINEWDIYGEGGAVKILENQVRELLGTEDAAYFPSGIMAQQTALRIHTDRVGSKRVALPNFSHLLVHEDDGPRIVHGFQFEMLTTGNQVATQDSLDNIPGKLGAILVELPLRDAGCLLPTWDELVLLSKACRERGIPLHFDGARLWESQPWFDRPLADIAGLADSIYVSFYKGLGGLSGSILAGSADFIKESRIWRHRLGGTVYHSTAEVVSALVGLRDLLGQIPDTVQFAKDLAAALPDCIRAQPLTPQTNHFLLYARANPDDLNKNVLSQIETSGLAFSKAWRPAPVPGIAMTELAIGSGATSISVQEVAELLGKVVSDAEVGLAKTK